jgi:hypothetical protein
MTFEQLPPGTCVEIPAFPDCLTYAGAMGFIVDKPASTPGHRHMIRQCGPLADMKQPRDFRFSIVKD